MRDCGGVYVSIWCGVCRTHPIVAVCVVCLGVEGIALGGVL